MKRSGPTIVSARKTAVRMAFSACEWRTSASQATLASANQGNTSAAGTKVIVPTATAPSHARIGALPESANRVAYA